MPGASSTALRPRLHRDRKGDDVSRGPDGMAGAAALSAQGEYELSTLKLVVIGGSACPPEDDPRLRGRLRRRGRHAWGMTEMSPIGTVGSFKPSQMALSHEEKLELKCKQGWSPFGVEMKIVDDADNELPWDGKRFGRLKVAGLRGGRKLFQGRRRRDPRRRRLLRYRRRRDDRPQRLHADHRSRQGRDQVGRRMDLLIDIEISPSAIPTSPRRR